MASLSELMNSRVLGGKSKSSGRKIMTYRTWTIFHMALSDTDRIIVKKTFAPMAACETNFTLLPASPISLKKDASGNYRGRSISICYSASSPSPILSERPVFFAINSSGSGK